MRVAYLDLNLVDFYEDYSIEPKRYGGGRVFASWLKQFPEFSILADSNCFNNLTPQENKNNCLHLDANLRARLTRGEPVRDIIPNAKSYDLFVHLHCRNHLNLEGLRAKELVWVAGYGEQINHEIEHLALYNDFQNPTITNPKTKVYKFKLGYNIPPFKLNAKRDFIFQCSRHVGVFNSREIASFCLRHGITGYFAGPIAADYGLFEFINNKTTFYLGEISEEVKLQYCRDAGLYTLLHNWPTPFSLSAIEALACGTPVVCCPLGFWPSLIRNGVNGFFVTNESELMKAWRLRHTISQTDCYLSAAQYPLQEMLTSIWKVFEQVVKS